MLMVVVDIETWRDPMLQSKRFSELEVGDEFVILGTEEPRPTWVKKSNSSAHEQGNVLNLFGHANGLRPATVVGKILPDPTPEELAAKAEQERLQYLAWFEWHLTTTIEDADSDLARFKVRLDADAADAFHWGMGALEASATRSVYCIIQALWLTLEVKDLEVVRKEASRRVLNGAKYVQNSSSPMANLVQVYKTAAWAKVVDWVNMHIE
jgi:hypothetical protein